jgi:hypothetical protein
MFNRVKNSFHEGASTIKGILVRADRPSLNQEDQAAKGSDTQSPLFRLGFHHQSTHADSDERANILRKEWKKYVKIHSVGEECDAQFSTVLDALERYHQGQIPAGKVDITGTLGKDSGLCVELARKLSVGIDDMTWVVQADSDSSAFYHLRDAKLFPLLFAISYLEWERSAVKGFCDLKLPSSLIRILSDHVESISRPDLGKQVDNRRDRNILIEDIVLEIIGRFLEHREIIEQMSDLGDASLSLLFNICTADSCGSEMVKHCRSGTLKTIARTFTIFESQTGRVDGAGSALANYLQVCK